MDRGDIKRVAEYLWEIPATGKMRVPARIYTTEKMIDKVAADKMVVGELERVWIDPPGASLIARMDTGASSSSLHAAKLVEFERDGDDWVRFEIAFDGQTTTVERPVERYVRVYQQADVEGTRRPVVRLRVALGDIQDTFDFTLANRAHLDQEVLLGRNFLKDVALVDVGRQFVQPARRPAAD